MTPFALYRKSFRPAAARPVEALDQVRPAAAPALARRISLLGTAAVVPNVALTSLELDQRLGFAPGTVEHRTGVRVRHVSGPADTPANLAARACQAALDASGLGWSDVDCLIAAYATNDQGMPSNSALLHRELQLDRFRVRTFDVNASCLSFLVALDLAATLIAAGRQQRIMIASADMASYGLDWRHLESSGIFGDGAAAALVGGDGPRASRVLAFDSVTISAGAELCAIPGGGSRFHPNRVAGEMLPLMRFRMNGKAVFRLVADHLPGFLERLLDAADTRLDDIALIVPHQASQLAMHHLRKSLGIAPERVVEIYRERGNQVAASLPSALDHARATGRISRGDRILLLGTGAGVSISGMVLEA